MDSKTKKSLFVLCIILFSIPLNLLLFFGPIAMVTYPLFSIILIVTAIKKAYRLFGALIGFILLFSFLAAYIYIMEGPAWQCIGYILLGCIGLFLLILNSIYIVFDIRKIDARLSKINIVAIMIGFVFILYVTGMLILYMINMSHPVILTAKQLNYSRFFVL